MSNRINIDELKKEYIGKSFNWLTVIDIYRDDHNKIIFKSQCKCGNIIIRVKKGFIKHPPMSCGCYLSSDEYRNKRKQWYDDHPEAASNLSSIKKKWYRDNPDKIREIAEHNRQLYIDNPEKRKIVGNRISEWFKENPLAVSNWAEHRRQFYKDHPEIGEARSRLYKEHPEILDKISQGNKKYNQEHPEKVERINELNRLDRFIKRQQFNYGYIIGYVHPDDVEFLISGKAKADSLIRTKCPSCGEYAYHNRNHLVSMEHGDFKLGKPPLCKKCHVELTSCFSSKYEDEIAKFISSFYTGELVRNDRSVLNGKELDIYIPEKKIAIEFNGDYWHNDEHKDDKYHLNKYLQCKEKGILLVSIFEFEWNSNLNEIKSYLRDLFDGKENKLSFSEDHSKMINNYPSPLLIHHIYPIEEYFIYTNGSTIHTCGYSVITNPTPDHSDM